jgi:hypothetical protein
MVDPLEDFYLGFRLRSEHRTLITQSEFAWESVRASRRNAFFLPGGDSG